MGTFKTYLALSLFISMLSIFKLEAITITNYTYPYDNKYLATISYLFGRPSEIPHKVLTIQPRSDRSHTPLLEGKEKIKMHLYPQKNEAPLVFVMPGVGGESDDSPQTQMLAEMLYKKGYTAITLPNTLSAQFAVAVSEKGIPGYCPEDIPQLYDMLMELDEVLKNKIGLKIKSYGYIGYSYGALEGGFLAKEDYLRKYFNFKAMVLINPPINLIHGMNRLDGFFHEGKFLNSRGRSIASSYTKENFFKATLKALWHGSFSLILKYAIGEDFRKSLTKIVFASQQITDLDVLKTPATPATKQARINEASRITFADYMKNFVYPTYGEGKFNSFEEFAQSTDIRIPLPYIKAHQGIYIMHNADDFLLENGDTRFIERELGSRFYLYPKGGHVGNLWLQTNKKAILNIMHKHL